MVDDNSGFARTYGVELLYDKYPSISKTEIARCVKKRCPGAELADGENSSLHFFHKDHLVKVADAVVPAQMAILQTDQAFKLTASLTETLEQSHSFHGAAAVVGHCHNTILVTDLMSGSLEYKKRLALFQNALVGILEAVPPLAIHWSPSGQFVDPLQFLKAFKQGGSSLFFAGALNVRLYNIANSPGTMLMDTLGLAALGLVDLQCHFRGFTPDSVAGVLASTGYYLFENGDVIEDGNTVQGTTRGSRWRCQREDSMIGPSRVVLDLDPGSPHAAGNRESR